jgi:hypothetical protein
MSDIYRLCHLAPAQAEVVIQVHSCIIIISSSSSSIIVIIIIVIVIVIVIIIIIIKLASSSSSSIFSSYVSSNCSGKPMPFQLITWCGLADWFTRRNSNLRIAGRVG